VFDGSDDRLENTSLDYGLIDEDASIFVALTPTTNRGLIIDQSFGHGGNEYGWNLHRGDDDWATIPQNSIVWNSHNYVGNQNYGMYAYSEENTSPINQKQLISLIKDGNQLAFHVNGYSTEMVDDTIYASNITYNSGYSLNIGRKVYGPDYLGFMPYDGDINEVIIFNRKLTNEEIIEIQNYLSNKWNLTSTVDSDGDGIPDDQDFAPSNSEQFGENVWTEDFESYSDSNLNGQQDWTVVTRNTSGQIYLEADFGFDGTRALKFPHSGAGVGNRAYKVFLDEASPFPSANQEFFVYEADIIKLCWGAFLGPAFDSSSDGIIDDPEQGPGFWIVGGCGDNGNKLRARLGDGSTIEADLIGNSWFRIRFVMDLSANQGQGSGTIFFKSLTDGETSWRTDATLTNFSLKLDTTADDSSNPTKWNALWLHFEGATAGLDNIRIEH
jgi:hypothetical protein